MNGDGQVLRAPWWPSLGRLAGLGLLLAAWQALWALGRLPGYLLGPIEIARALIRALQGPELHPHIGASLYRAVTGFALGTFSGVALGVLSGISRPVASFWDPLVSMIYPLPKSAFLPVLVVWFGLGHASRIALIALACFFPAFINAYSGVKNVQRLHIWAAQNAGATRGQIFLKVILPSAMPSIFTGMRVSLALSYILLFGAEMFGSRNGLGYLIMTAEANLRFDLMFVAITVIGVLGYLSDRLLALARRRLLPWEPGEE